MEAFQQRVVDEKVDLSEKLSKLQAFFDTPIFKALPADEQARMRAQAFHMSGYEAALNARIDNFKEQA